MQQLNRVSVDKLRPDANQPRQHFGDDDINSLGENLLAHGQQVPIIVYRTGTEVDGEFDILDGQRRWLAAKSAGIAELWAVVLPERPSESALRLLQMSLDVHRSSLTAMERSDFLQRIRQENGWSVSELASRLHIKQPMVSKLLACQRLDEPIRQLLHAGKLDLEKAVIVSQEPNADHQREMVKLYAHLPREQFRQKAKASEPPAAASVQRARFCLADGAAVVVEGKALTLADAIANLLETVRQLKRVQAKTQDIAEAQKLLRSKARTKHVAPATHSSAG